MMKKSITKQKALIALMMALVLTMAGMLVACDSSGDKASETDTAATDTTSTPAPTPTPTPTPPATTPPDEPEEPDVETVANISELASAQVGDVFYFGEFSYTNYDALEVTENFGWRVLAVEEGKVLVTTEKVIDHHAWNASEVNRDVIAATWETCTIRTWINNDLFNAMPAIIKDNAAVTACVNDPNPQTGTPGGNPTEDKVFLLSAAEVELYMPTDEDRASDAEWWLRTIGRNDVVACRVYDDGTLDLGGTALDADRYSSLPGARPCIWLNVG